MPPKKYTKVCRRCNGEFETYSATKIYCTPCSTLVNREQAAEKRRLKNPKWTPTVICAICGCETKRKSSTQKVCPECKAVWDKKVKAEREAAKRGLPISPKTEEAQTEEENRPYTLTEVAAAARKHNMSYGNYVAAWNEGTVEPPERIPPKKKKRGRPKKYEC